MSESRGPLFGGFEMLTVDRIGSRSLGFFINRQEGRKIVIGGLSGIALDTRVDERHTGLCLA